jgi:hypothetical protein
MRANFIPGKPLQIPEKCIAWKKEGVLPSYAALWLAVGLKLALAAQMARRGVTDPAEASQRDGAEN